MGITWYVPVANPHLVYLHCTHSQLLAGCTEYRDRPRLWFLYQRRPDRIGKCSVSIPCATMLIKLGPRLYLLTDAERAGTFERQQRAGVY